MRLFELDYAQLVSKVLGEGERRKTRNQETLSVFGEMLTIPVGEHGFPLIQGRQIFYKGVFGELAAILRKPTNISDFKRWGCNYWDKWGNKETGELNIDYGNAWFADGQIEELKYKLAHRPADRRMIINGWVPANLDELSLPCCHYAYQFYVSRPSLMDKPVLHMLWHQRSVDLMVGLPSDIVFAAAWLIAIANEFGFAPGSIKMTLGDVHIYSGHVDNAHNYLERVHAAKGRIGLLPTYTLNAPRGLDFCIFEPSWLTINNYEHNGKLEFELYE